MKHTISKRAISIGAIATGLVLVAMAAVYIVAFSGPYSMGDATMFGSAVDARHRYSFSWESDSSIDYLTESASLDDSGSIAGANYEIYAYIDGAFETRVIATHPKSLDVSIAFNARTALLEVNGALDERSSDGLAEALSKPMVVSFDTRGRILGFGVRGDYELATYRNTIASILADLEFIIQEPPDSGIAEWTAEQHDPSGPYVAEYRVIKNTARALELLKVKTSYTERERLSRRLGVLFPSIDTRNHASARFMNGCLESATAEEVQFLTQGKKRVGVNRYSFQARRERQTSTRADATGYGHTSAPATTSLSRYHLYREPTRREIFEATHVEKLAGRTPDDVLAELTIAETEATGVADYTNADLMASLRAVAFLYPESAGLLAARTFDVPSDSLSLYYIPDALMDAGHAPAQSALCELVTYWEKNVSVCSGLIPYLGRLLDPGAEAVGCVRRLSLVREAEIARTASLNLGLMAASIGIQGREAEAALLVDELRERYHAAIDAPSRARALRVLGNAQAASNLGLILEAMRDDSPDVRSSAAYAARFLSAPEIDEALRSNLASEPEGIVRLATATTLGMRPADDALVALYGERLKAERSGQVKARILDNLYAIADEFPLAIRAIERTALQDRDQDIRDYAAYFLERLMQDADSGSTS